MAASQTRILQLGQQSVFGTGVVATSKLMGVTDASFTVDPEIFRTPELGRMGPSPLVEMTKFGLIGMCAAQLTYEDALYFAHGLFGPVVPTGTTDKAWAFVAPVAAVSTPTIFTAEYGVPGGYYKVRDALLNKTVFSWKAGGVWDVKSDILGTNIGTVVPAVLTDRAVVLARQTEAYIDEWSGTMGTTLVPASIIAAEVTVDPSRHLKQFGERYSENWGEKNWDCSMKVTLEWNATTKAYIDALVTGAGGTLLQKQIRITTNGAANRRIQFSMPGSLSNKPQLYSDRDGNVVIDLEFASTYHASFGNYFRMGITNQIGTLV